MQVLVLCLEVRLVADEETSDFVICVGLRLIQPLSNVIEWLSVGDVVDEKYSDGSSVVGAGDGLKGFLSSLYALKCTVSHICNLIGFPPTWIIFDPNSTPMVVSWSNLNFF